MSSITTKKYDQHTIEISLFLLVCVCQCVWWCVVNTPHVDTSHRARGLKNKPGAANAIANQTRLQIPFFRMPPTARS
jgi:hypothetical protein